MAVSFPSSVCQVAITRTSKSSRFNPLSTAISFGHNSTSVWEGKSFQIHTEQWYFLTFHKKQRWQYGKSNNKTVSQTCFHPPDAPRRCSSSRCVVLAAQQNEGLHSAVNSPAVQTPKRQVTLFRSGLKKPFQNKDTESYAHTQDKLWNNLDSKPSHLVEALAAVSMKQHSFTSLHQIPNASRCCKNPSPLRIELHFPFAVWEGPLLQTRLSSHK